MRLGARVNHGAGMHVGDTRGGFSNQGNLHELEPKCENRNLRFKVEEVRRKSLEVKLLGCAKSE